MTESILFLFQRISVAFQRFNAVLLHDGFPSEDHPDYSFSTSNLFLLSLIFSTLVFTRVKKIKK